jgi:tetratricopeptide (TPR) repeat protein
MQTDVRGLELTTENADAVRHYDETVASYLAFSTNTGQHLKATLTADPQMPMALITQGYFMHLFCNPALENRAVQAREAAEAAIAERGATPREQLHLSALRAWNNGNTAAAAAKFEQILLAWPHDVLALKLSNFHHFYLHGGAAMRESTSRVMPAWSEEMPGYGYMLGVHSFSLEESGDYAAAEAAGKRAVEINNRDIWATHAVAHVMEMQCREHDGIAWLEGLCGNWTDMINFRFHTWWHLAMFYLELANYDAVLDIYDRNVWSEPTDEYLDQTNAAAMLWRLQDRGVDVGDRWKELADVSERHLNDALLAFADAHYIMALAADGRREAAETLLASLERAAAAGETTQSIIDRDVAVPIGRATLALSQGNPRAALNILLPLRDEIWRIGGSHAQRDVWQQMLIRASIDSGATETARGLLAQRTALRPNNAWSWSRYADVLESDGASEDAANARARATGLLAA